MTTLVNPFMSHPASGGPWTPASLASLSAWFDASDASTFSFSSGSTISQWRDLGPNAYHLGVSGTAPTRTRTINSLAAVDFGGSGSLYRTNSPINNATTGAWAVFAVAIADATTGQRSVVGSDTGGGTRVGQLIRVSDGALQTIAFRSGTPVTDTGPTWTAGATYVLRSLNGGTTNVEAFVNAVGNGATSLGGTQNYSASTMLGLGGDASGTAGNQRLDGAIGEVICCSSALGSSDITAVETYLATKWGVTL